MKNGALLILDYKINERKLNKARRCIMKSCRSSEELLALLNGNTIEDVIVFNTETERVEHYKNKEMLDLVSQGRIANLPLDGKRREWKCRLGSRYIVLAYAWESGLVVRESLEKPKDEIVGVVGTSTDEQYIIGVTLDGKVRFIRFQDIIDGNIGENSDILKYCLKDTIEPEIEEVDLSNILLKREVTDEEKIRLRELSDRNNMLSITGNTELYWSSDGSLYIDRDIKEVNFIGLKSNNNCMSAKYCKNILDRLLLDFDGNQPKILESINIQNGALYIPDKLFWSAYKLSSLRLPDDLAHIGEGNFVNTQLKEIDLSNCNNVKSIGWSSFSSNSMLEKLIFPNRCKIIGDNSYEKNSRLKELTFPKDLERIECHSLFTNTMLEKLVLPEAKFTGVMNYFGWRQTFKTFEGYIPNLKMIVTTRRNMGSAKVLAYGRDIIKVIK